MTKKYFILHPAVFKLDGGAMFGIIPKPLWSKQIPADELNRIQLSLRVMLIQTATKNILVDTGIGDYHGEKFDDRFGVVGPQNPLVESLQKNFNLRPSDITDLIVTHLHFDHVGGLGHDEQEHLSVFPNATLHIHRQHYDYALHPTMRDAGSFHTQYFKPLIEKADQEGKVHWLTGEQGTILTDGPDSLYFRVSHGHTPFLVHPYDDKFIYMADLVPTSAHISIPWVMGYDISPGITTVNKAEFYRFIIDKNLTMIFEHDMKVWGAKVKPKGEHEFEAAKTYSVSEIDPQKSEVFFE
ncbi:MBL fold metallo-hydrolase [Peredibacter sp. HCB2-198]|uniref:MBL fold metallo-hydrolase n=1 Tax=Peredibacter sp. HCB2-198 TaxID=3383025 RepID=UPI0038B52DEB